MIGFYVDNLPSRSSINVTLEGQRVPVETVKKGAGNMDRSEERRVGKECVP